MFPKAIIVALASAAFVFAAPQGAPAKSAPAAPATASPAPIPVSQCNTGNIKCCNQVSSINDPSNAQIKGLLGAAVQGITGLIGINCSPLTIIGGALGTNCAQQPVCCQGAKFGGLINVGCIPISL